jgi:SAM-dependent methyltransferase
MGIVSLDEAARCLGVSTATIRNWAKAGHITPFSTRPLRFLREDVKCFQDEIASGSFNRLRGRANKTRSRICIAHADQELNSLATKKIEELALAKQAIGLDCNALMFLAALRQLELKEEVRLIRPDRGILDLACFGAWKRKCVMLDMQEWAATVSKERFTNDSEIKEFYLELCPLDDHDWLGALYQGVTEEGDRSSIGSYFTSREVIRDSLSNIKRYSGRFIDPCCGSGRYLIAAAKILGCNSNDIYGYDIDSVAVRIARVNLFLVFIDEDFLPNIKKMDALSELATGNLFCETNHLLGTFDIVATNPPWGAYKNCYSNKGLSSRVSSGETYSLFLELAIRLLSQGGSLSFILPESILNIQGHADIRKLLLDEISLTRIKVLGKQFTGVFTAAICLSGRKEKSSICHRLGITSMNSSYDLEQSAFHSSPGYVFDIASNSDERELLDKLFQVDNVKLACNADWALGIVTGNNNKFILEYPTDQAEPIYRGKDVFPFQLGNPQIYIKFKPRDFQQVAKEVFYRAPEKLVYRFISNKLVFAYDAQGLLTLNSANVLIPRLPGIGIKVALGFLNSAVFQFIHLKRFSTHKVLRGNLEQLPFPLLSTALSRKMDELVASAIVGNNTLKDIDEAVHEAFGLSESDTCIIHNAVGKT